MGDEKKPPQVKTLLPDPYGRGFSRNEAVWQSQDSNRLFYGKMARNPVILFFKTLVGFGFAVAAESWKGPPCE